MKFRSRLRKTLCIKKVVHNNIDCVRVKEAGSSPVTRTELIKDSGVWIPRSARHKHDALLMGRANLIG
ncbi:unnamed protein product [Danaus chrysippus]|uniref:(African queen) hypothetical protein n=1 Tax=Danaus chrysippus TaxID=151541 RepID=A0A8J2R887_9NEOP|nr:unnamed protein product [Danaus chrysippus]